jgi:hypothetical protein
MCREEETRPASPPVVGDGKTIYVSFDGRTSVVSVILPDVVIPPAKKGSLKWASGTFTFLTVGSWNALALNPCRRDGSNVSEDEVTVYLWEEADQTRAVCSDGETPVVIGYVTDEYGDNIATHFAKAIYYAGA